MKPDKDFKYDTKEFFKKLSELQEYRVGKRYFFLSNGKIAEGIVCTVKFEYNDPGITHTYEHRYNVDLSITLSVGGSKITSYPNNLFETREEAAEAFLKANDVPSELLRVLKQGKFVVNPEYTSDYWDCNCDVEYIHPASTEMCPACKAERTNQPDSKISEVKQENMFIYE